MKNQHWGITLIVILGLVSCGNLELPSKPEKLYEKYKSAVVLIKHKFYYELDLGTGLKLFIVQLENLNRNSIYFNEAEALSNAKTIYGTGFFISQQGLIATNKHVAYPIENEGEIFSRVGLILNDIRFECEAKDRLYQDSILRINNHIIQNSDWLSNESLTFLNSMIENWNAKRRDIGIVIAYLNAGVSDGKISCKTIFLGIVPDNTFVNKESDYKECFLVKKSNQKEIDLALIQTKDKSLPISVKNIFDFCDHNPNLKNGSVMSVDSFDVSKKIVIDTKVYMIGFNNGLELATTSDGIKAQFTQGTVSQESDEYRVLYSIPSLSGSSGSPVIDEWGNLVAINFAKVSNTQSFNYGIPAKHLEHLIKEMR